MKTKALSCLFLIFVSISLLSNSSSASDSNLPFFNLIIKVPGGGYYGDYGLLIADYLRDINIEVDVKIQSGISFDKWIECNVLVRDWDLTMFSFDETVTLDLREYYTENGSKNLFGLDSTIPYNNESEDMQIAYQVTDDLAIMQQTMYEWEILMMDKILPLLPMYGPRSYVGTWANTLGYEGRWGIADSLPYLYYDGYHTNQESLEEFNMAIYKDWTNLNPVSSLTENERDIADFIFEPIIQWSPDYSPLKTGLVKDWEEINDYHYKFYIRDDIFWTPSYNCSLRNSNSEDLITIPEEELMVGLKGNFSNGYNQQVKAKDAVFTLLTLSNSDVSEMSEKYTWLSNCYVDEADPLAFHITIDGNPETPELDYYFNFWNSIHPYILPEFFLNSTDSTISYTNGGDEYMGLFPELTLTDQWVSFSKSPFSCGKYMLDFQESNILTKLTRNPDWFEIGAIDGTDQDLDIESIYVNIISDLDTQLDNFECGKLDWVDLTNLVSTRQQMQADSNFEVQTYIEQKISFVAFNLDRNLIGGLDNNIWLDEPGKTNHTRALAIRKAICHSIDRYEINTIMHRGEFLVAHEPAPRFWYWYYGFPITYNYDLDLAWEWMEAAGFDRPIEVTPTETETIPSTAVNFPELLMIVSLSVAIILISRRRKNKKLRE